MPSQLFSKMRSSSHQLEYLPLPNPSLSKKSFSRSSSSFRLCFVGAGLVVAIPCLLLLLLFLLSPLFFTSMSPNSSYYIPRYTNCGTTPAEARQRNCHFDLLSFSWQTTECFDEENTAAFLAHDGWRFYTQLNSSSQQISLDTALQGEVSLAVDWKYHVTHCTYMWRGMHRAFTKRGWIDDHLAGFGHTLHCQAVLLDTKTKMDEVVVVGMVRYPECRRVSIK